MHSVGKKRKFIRVKPSDTQYLLGFKAPTLYFGSLRFIFHFVIKS
jgi:hypothetical protein